MNESYSFTPEMEQKKDLENLKEIKLQKLEEIRRKIDVTTDRLGAEIDPGIKEAVIALNAMEFNTIQSCVGHDDEGHPYPWIMIEAPGKPEEEYIGEKELYEKFVKEHDIDIDQLLHGEPQELYEELQRQVGTLSEHTPEFISWSKKNKQLYERATQLLDEFYNNHKVNSEIQLHAIAMDKDSMIFQVRSDEKLRDKVMDDTLTEDERKEILKKLEPRRKEMVEFSEFLKNKFLQS